jgi:ubiquinone/menaquinone biosynthesis C-methylase UbiE
MNSQINLNQPLFDSPRRNDCRQSGWKAQFACPTGKIGQLVGHLMAYKNAGMNQFAVESLDPQPEDQILEIGFGHGRTIRKIAERAEIGFVAGVDISDVMVRQATKHNRELIQAGRVEVCQGSVSNIPFEFARFNKVLAVNNYQFWPDPELNLDEIRRVLRERGLLVLCLRMKDPAKPFQLAPGFTEEEVEEVVGLVRWVGFQNIRTLKQQAGREATCVLADR